jgi:hypothetical protein
VTGAEDGYILRDIQEETRRLTETVPRILAAANARLRKAKTPSQDQAIRALYRNKLTEMLTDIEQYRLTLDRLFKDSLP